MPDLNWYNEWTKRYRQESDGLMVRVCRAGKLQVFRDDVEVSCMLCYGESNLFIGPVDGIHHDSSPASGYFCQNFTSAFDIWPGSAQHHLVHRLGIDEADLSHSGGGA